MPRVNFVHALQRWYRLQALEATALADELKRGGVVLSREALDHLTGLSVEACLKALMIKEGMVQAEADGDYPRGAGGRRPHIDELYAVFTSNAKSRKGNDWLRRLEKKPAASLACFQDWRAEHRYAQDGTVSEATVEARVQVASRLKAIASEEGVF